MHMQQLVLPFTFLTCVILPSNSGRHLQHRILKRSPQLSLTVEDGDDTVTRSHPPTAEDLEERRQALVNSLAGFAMTRGPGGGGIAEVGLDLVGGLVRNAGQAFAPFTNATRKAAQGLPRLGVVINGLTDGARSYRKQVAGPLRSSADVLVNNGIKLFTTASARGTEFLGGVLKLMRTLIDKFTRAIASLSQNLSRGIANTTKRGSQFLARNIERTRKALSNPTLTQPARDVISLGTNLAKGLTSDFTEAQTWVNDGVQSKIALGNALIPRVRLSSFLSPLTDPESSSNSNSEGYNKKRESEDEETEKVESVSTGDRISPSDILELLDPTEEKKANSNDKLEQSESKTVPVESSKPEEKSTEKNEIKSSTSTNPTMTTEVLSSTTSTPSSTTAQSTSSTTESPGSNEISEPSIINTSSSTPSSSSSAGKVSLSPQTVEDLFGIATRLLNID